MRLLLGDQISKILRQNRVCGLVCQLDKSDHLETREAMGDLVERLVERMCPVVTTKAGKIVATSDLEAGDLVFVQPAVCAGPGQGAVPVCLGCLTRGEEGVLSSCEKCSWPVCCKECEGGKDHLEECKLFVQQNLKCPIKNLDEKSTEMDFIAPLRFLLKMQKNPFSDSKLKEFLSKTKKKEVYGPMVSFIKTKCGMTKFKDEEISSIVGLFDQFGTSLSHSAISVHDDVDLLEDSCSPNTYHTGQQDRSVVYRASRPISRGEVITHCRGDITQCNLFRRRQLARYLGLDCWCERCRDGREMGTCFSSVSCSSCCGEVSSEDPRDETAEWKCGKCGEKKSGEECINILDTLKKKLDEALKDPSIGTAKYFEDVVEQKEEWKLVPPNSQIIIDAEKALLFIYQYHPDYFNDDFDMLDSKIAYCEHILSVMDLTSPGQHYPRVLIEYENINALVSFIQCLILEKAEQEQLETIIDAALDLSIKTKNMMGQEEDMSMYKEISKLSLRAVEAKQDVRKGVNLYKYPGEDEKDEASKQVEKIEVMKVIGEIKEKRKPPTLLRGLPVMMRSNHN